MEYYKSVENRGYFCYLADPVELKNARLQTYKLENKVHSECLTYFATVSVMRFGRLLQSDSKLLNKIV